MTSRADRRALTWGIARVALMVPAAFAVHQLRYLLAYGGAAGVELQRQGHSYLHSLVPWIVLLLALVAGGFLWALGRAFSGHTSVPRFALSFAALWAACSACLIVIYAGQELLEGLMLAGHPAGLVGVFGFGGWWAIPVAGCVGLVLAAVFHGARWALEEVARRHARPPAPRSLLAPAASGRPDVFVPRPAPIAGGWSGRGPPG